MRNMRLVVLLSSFLMLPGISFLIRSTRKIEAIIRTIADSVWKSEKLWVTSIVPLKKHASIFTIIAGAHPSDTIIIHKTRKYSII